MWSLILEAVITMLYTEILKDPSVFSKIYKKGARASGSGLCAYFVQNRRPYNRFGITAGKKVGGAVERNRAKRIIRAAYRKNELLLPLGYDIVVVARADIIAKKSTELDGFMLKLSKEMNNRR